MLLLSRTITPPAAAFAAGTAVVACLLAGCGPQGAASAGSQATTNPTTAASATTASGSPASSAAPTVDAGTGNAGSTPAEVRQRLRTVTPGANGDAVVALADGSYEGASVDKSGTVEFWSYRGGQWHRVGQSTYPVLPNRPGDATAQGQLLPGMTHATFILTGGFSEDGTANNAAYTADDNGKWGLIVPEERGDLIPSGHGVRNDPQFQLGINNGVYFANGKLETANCSDTLPFADCHGDTRVIKYYSWHPKKSADDYGSFGYDHGAGLPH